MIKELLFKIADGDKNAFEELHKILNKKIFKVIFKIVHDHEKTKDLMQETYLKIWKNANKYVGLFNDERWILVVAKRTAIDYVRKNKKTIQGIPLDEAVCSLQSENDFLKIETSDLFDIFSDDEKLVAKYRTMGYERLEICQITGFKIDKVKFLLKKIKEKIKNI